MKQFVRSFAFGLLTAGIILLVTFYFTDDTENNAEDIPVEKMIKSVESEGYHVLTESEYISASVQDDNANSEPEATGQNDNQTNSNESSDQQDSETESDNNNSIAYTLSIESGMNPSAIASQLAENDIIENADVFSDYMEEEGYSTQIQLGDFELTSDLGHYEIAERITK